MKCPACEENSLEDNPRFGVLSCPQCKSRLLYSAEGLREAAVARGDSREREHLPAKTVYIRNHGPHLQAPLRCVGCQAAIVSTTYYTGSILQGTAFLKKEGTEVVQVDLGEIATWERTYPIVLTTLVNRTKTVPYLRRQKGPLCDKCASNPHCVEIKQRDGTIKREQIVKTDPLREPGWSSIPAIEVIQRPDEIPLRTLSKAQAERAMRLLKSRKTVR